MSLVPDVTVNKPVTQLGWAGVSPFYLAAILAFDSDWANFADELMLAYGTGILAFLAGTLWGSAPSLPQNLRANRLILSNVLVLVLVASWLWLPIHSAAVAQLTVFWIIYFLEQRQSGPKGWYLKYRLRLTLCVTPAYLLFLGSSFA